METCNVTFPYTVYMNEDNGSNKTSDNYCSRGKAAIGLQHVYRNFVSQWV